MATIATICLIKPCFYMGNIKDGYHSIAIQTVFGLYLKFHYKVALLKFATLPNGQTEKPRIFTKVLRPKLQCGYNMKGKKILYLIAFNDLSTAVKSKDCGSGKFE